MKNAPLALKAAKQTIDRAYGQTQETGLLLEHLAELEVLESEDLKEAIMAKLEKREPEFKGR